MDSSTDFAFRERGRTSMSVTFCRAYFEVLSTPAHVNTLEVYAINGAGHVIGHGTVHRIEGMRAGMIFELRLTAQTDQVFRWQMQGGSIQSPRSYVCHVEALTKEETEDLTETIRYVEPPSSVAEATKVMPKLKNGWSGVVIGSNRSSYYHHPDCRRARALNPGSRHEYSEPRQAWEAGLQPCFDCLWCPQ